MFRVRTNTQGPGPQAVFHALLNPIIIIIIININFVRACTTEQVNRISSFFLNFLKYEVILVAQFLRLIFQDEYSKWPFFFVALLSLRLFLPFQEECLYIPC